MNQFDFLTDAVFLNRFFTELIGYFYELKQRKSVTFVFNINLFQTKEQCFRHSIHRNKHS